MFHYLIHYVLVKQLDNATCNRHLVTNKLLFFTTWALQQAPVLYRTLFCEMCILSLKQHCHLFSKENPQQRFQRLLEVLKFAQFYHIHLFTPVQNCFTLS